MSEQTTRSANDRIAKSRQTTISYHPVWMARWTRSSSNTSAEKYELEKGKAKVSPLIDKPFIVSNNQSPYDEHNGKKMNGRSLNACLSDFNTSLLFDRDWFKKMQRVSGIRFLPTPSVEDKSNNKSLSGCDMETMRLCTTVDSVEAMPGSRMLITKKGNANLLQENDVFRAKRFVKKTNENISFGQGNRGVKLQPLSSSLNSEGINNVRDVEVRKDTINDESSSETDTMGMNIFKEKNVDSAVQTSPENLCPSSSGARSLETGVLPVNAEQAQTKPNINPDDPNPSNRWAKRLKPSSPNSSPRGTKITNPTENLSHDKMRKNFKSIPISSLTSSVQSPRNNKHHGKETNVSESLFSHVWIKRWLREWSRVMEEKSDPTVGKVCGSRELKSSLDDDDDDLEKKQFPSIGAMALMRKAMGGFQSCEIQKRGSIAVWNTKGTF